MHTKMMILAPALAMLITGCDDELAKAHRAAANRVRTYVYNTDGCDMLYYPARAPITPEGFTRQRLTSALGTKISTISYCPLASGFGYFTSLRAGDPLTNSILSAKGTLNGTLPFWEKYRTDALEMALEFSRTNGFERFMSIRMNDSHDGSTDTKKGDIHPLFSTFRLRHPDCLMGSRADNQWPTVCRWQWTCCNFAKDEVRDFVRKFIREFCENYDMEGIELDFCRHPAYFKSVAYGDHASEAELKMMTDLMRDIRNTTLKYERKKGHPILLSARVPDSVAFCRAIGLDVATWLKSKLLDSVIVGCYFNLEDPQTFAELAHASGVKCYASVDESRIPGSVGKRPIIKGRDSIENYHARYAAAMSAGCDGVYLFNLENARLHERTLIDPRETDGLNKIYFATERGAGGWAPPNYLKDGFSYKKLPRVEPTMAKKNAFHYSQPQPLEIRLGEDFAKAAAKGLKPTVTVIALVDGTVAPRLTLNGYALPDAASYKDGFATFEKVDPAFLKKGMNRFTLASPSGSVDALFDFAVKFEYAAAK